MKISDYEILPHIHWSSSFESIPTADEVDVEFNIVVEGNLKENHSLKIEVFPPISCATIASMHSTAIQSSLTLVHDFSLGGSGISHQYLSAEVHSESNCTSQMTSFRLTGSVMNPLLWTAETPYQYLIVISILDRDSQEIDVESCCFGFKEISISGPDNQLLVNGVPIMIAGVNHHEFYPSTGRSVSCHTMKTDAVMLKEFNFNAVRLSHYPHHHYWLEVCNKYGLYVIDECNIETHGFQWSGQAVGYLSSQESWLDAHLSRLIRMYERDKNMTAVIGWSLGNESGVGEAHKKMYRWIKQRDQSGRYVQYESGGAVSEVTDVICPMYLRPDWCMKKSQSDLKRRPVILCEYAHAMGNSSGALSHYWRCFRDPQYPRMQGGFIWDFVDQGLSLDGKPGKYGYGGDFNDYPNTAQFCINGVFGPDRTPHPMAYEAKALQSPIDILSIDLQYNSCGSPKCSLNIQNYRSFLTLSDVILEVSIESTTVPLLNELSHSIHLRSLPEVFPLSSRVVDISFYFERLINFYRCREQKVRGHFRSPSNSLEHEYWISICAFSFVNSDLGSGLQLLKKISFQHPLLSPIMTAISGRPNLPVPLPPLGNLTVSYPCQNMIDIAWSSQHHVTISQDCGRIISWHAKDFNIVQSPIDVCLWRAPTDNDR